MAYESLPLFPHVRPEKPKKGLTPTQAAYLAGLLDGEGCFSMTRRKRGLYQDYYVFETHITIGLVTPELVEEMRRMVPWGESTVRRRESKLVGRQRPAYYLKWYTSAAENICRAILPYIRLKKPHVELMLALAEARKLAVRDREEQRIKNWAYPAWFYDIQMSALARFRLLNLRGQDNEPV